MHLVPPLRMTYELHPLVEGSPVECAHSYLIDRRAADGMTATIKWNLVLTALSPVLQHESELKARVASRKLPLIIIRDVHIDDSDDDIVESLQV
ncbi:hypothetical protein EVAR_19789_1 [Eumeta japonica]|uniref:Uncharacterized protein n=1 Tax=Eumeta variegata TaxID=151549 RepID=A0A4C1URV3_EUMVA|nr:hypothetical protein EVAR_19789_1 [Eumeta japonica]